LFTASASGWTRFKIDTSGNVTQTGALNAAGAIITSTGANALSVGRQGTTTPVLNIDASTANVVTGLQIKGAAAGAGLAITTTSSGTDENLTFDAKGAGTLTFNGTATGNISLARATGVTGALTVTSAGASALAVGRQGSTSPALQVDASAGTSVTGLKITAGAAGGGLALAVVGGNTDENLTLDAKGAGTLTLNGTATGGITLSRATGVTGALTVTSAGASAFAVGRQGSTSPALQVDASTGVSVTGLKITAGAAGGGLALALVGGNTDENLTVAAKGAGGLTFGNSSAASITFSVATSGHFILQNNGSALNCNDASGKLTTDNNGYIKCGTDNTGSGYSPFAELSGAKIGRAHV
jgi:hypothetical protein